ncbi:MAG: hypothetical protein OEW15_18780 [Nitrospirota bacterium]|nr:hypothetical protein [Nitrospirota bacterium]
MSRFDYVKYDEEAIKIQDFFKSHAVLLEQNVNLIGATSALPSAPDQLLKLQSLGRSKAMAITKLEEFYMWIGKAVRDDQILRNGSAPLQEERKDG